MVLDNLTVDDMRNLSKLIQRCIAVRAVWIDHMSAELCRARSCLSLGNYGKTSKKGENNLPK